MGAAEKVIAIHSGAWKDGGKSTKQWRASLSEYAYQRIGDKGVDQVTTADVMAVVLRVLDVGSGPVSQVGTLSDRWRIEITAVDPLAAEYLELCDEFGLPRRNGVVERAGDAETLTESFAEETFDLVHCRNALDHASDPLLGIRRMVAVCKVGGACFLAHATNEGETQRYDGLHQWNLAPVDDGDLAIRSRDGQQVLLRGELQDVATVQAVPTGAWHTVTIKRLPPAETR